jgi:hypothetical protein
LCFNASFVHPIRLKTLIVIAVRNVDMKDDIKYVSPLVPPETTADLQRRVAQLWQEISARLTSANSSVARGSAATPVDLTHLENLPKGRPPVATFSELLVEKSSRPSHLMPTGLKIALLAVSKLKEIPPGDISELLADIRCNLDWADAELRSVSVTPCTIRHWLQLEMAREQIASFELDGPTKSTQAATS